jgi:hypothetical protein
MTIAFAAICGNGAGGQPLSQTTLKIDLQNAVGYQRDIADPSQFATNAGVTPSTAPKNFFEVTLIADIVAVNGQAAKGTYVGRTRVVNLSPTGNGAIADVTRTALREHLFEILQPDGTPIGAIISLGLSGGPAPPGMPSSERGNWAIVGGTGAFLGARGTVGGTNGVARAASMAEDPANRRLNGGTAFSFLIHVIPMSAPQIIQTANGPAVVHSNDFSLVSSAKPASAGEVLSLFATGLGPTVPEVDLGLPFPSSTLSAVNSPLTVMVNGKPAEVLAAVGYPGAVDGYQVNFRVPSETAQGTATIQLNVAWIPGPTVSVSIQ